MRLGKEDEAKAMLEQAWNAGFQDRSHAKYAEPAGQLQEFRYLQDAHHDSQDPEEGSGAAAPVFAGRARSRSSPPTRRNTSIKLSVPVQVEVYPDHEDFAVRTMGMPGLGALGVTFDTVVAMDSPSAADPQRGPGSFHWASTLWHEMSHVYVLSMTNSRVPRWFTEGLAVYEETAINPDWGDRLDHRQPSSRSRTRSCFRSPTWIAASSIPPIRAGDRQLLSGRQDHHLHRAEVGLRHGAEHDPRFRRQHDHDAGDREGIEDEAGGVRQAVHSLGGGADQDHRGRLRRLDQGRRAVSTTRSRTRTGTR